MDWMEALEIVVAREGVERYRYLCSEAYHDHKRMREEISRMASETDFPPLARQAANFAGAMGRAALAAVTGEQVFCTPEQQAEREAICQGCDKLINGKCVLCGCPYKRKIKLATEICPIGLWPKLEVAS
jgi:hypothetical protein